MSSQKRNVHTALGGRTAKRFSAVSAPYLDRGEKVPADLLDREFKKICGDYEIRHGISLSYYDKKIILEKWVPRSQGQWERRQQRNKEGIAA
jgi:hypothetical protein